MVMVVWTHVLAGQALCKALSEWSSLTQAIDSLHEDPDFIAYVYDGNNPASKTDSFDWLYSGSGVPSARIQPFGFLQEQRGDRLNFDAPY